MRMCFALDLKDDPNEHYLGRSPVRKWVQACLRPSAYWRLVGFERIRGRLKRTAGDGKLIGLATALTRTLSSSSHIDTDISPSLSCIGRVSPLGARVDITSNEIAQAGQRFCRGWRRGCSRRLRK
jgi:hypothetical protein